MKERLQSIQARLSLAITIAALVMALAGVLMFTATRELASMPRFLQERTYAVGLALRDFRSDLLEMHNGLEGLAEAPTQLRIRRFSAETAEIEGRIAGYLTLIDEKFPTERALIATLGARFDEWRGLRDMVLDAAQDDDKVLVYMLVKTDGTALAVQMMDALDELLLRANRFSQQAKAENAAFSARTLLGVLITLLMGFSALLALSIVLRRSIIVPTTEISDSIRRIAAGDLGSEIPHTDRGDEIGAISRSAKVFLEYAVAIQNSQFDLVTGLAMRAQLHEHMKMLRADPDNRDLAVTIIHFDLDRFSEINDSFGRAGGDAVLQHVARVLRDHARIYDFIARDGADSFIMLVIGMADVDDVSRFAGEICVRIGQGFQFEGEPIRPSCSAGIVACDRQTPVEALLSCAEGALGEARKLGPGSIEIYTDEMDERLRQRRETLMGLKFALKHDEIVPFFQPQICASSGELRGFEALVRWNHPEHGVLSPWQFIDVATGAGLLSDVTDMMISKSLRQLALWRSKGFDVPRVSLNFAASDLGRAGFADYLMLEIDRNGLRPDDICVELLESAMIDDVDNPVSKALNRLGQLGFPIELDDFGTGHAAISTLHLVKLSGIKIDRTFITKLDQHVEQQHLTRGILRISRALHISTVAEGVESEAEREMLVTLGCDMLQGFWIAPPMCGPDATLWIEEYVPKACRQLLAEPA